MLWVSSSELTTRAIKSPGLGERTRVQRKGGASSHKNEQLLLGKEAWFRVAESYPGRASAHLGASLSFWENEP